MQPTKFSRYGESQQSKEGHSLSAESTEDILTLQYKSKNVSYKQPYTYICGIPATLKKIGSTEKYAGP
jgi:hypothetical protein